MTKKKKVTPSFDVDATARALAPFGFGCVSKFLMADVQDGMQTGGNLVMDAVNEHTMDIDHDTEEEAHETIHDLLHTFVETLAAATLIGSVCKDKMEAFGAGESASVGLAMLRELVDTATRDYMAEALGRQQEDSTPDLEVN